MAEVASPAAAGQGAADLTANRLDRARAALARLASPAARGEIELRPPEASEVERAAWRRTALTFVASAVMAATLAQHGQAAAADSGRARGPVAKAASGVELSPYLAPVVVKIDGKEIETLHPMERVRLCQVAAREARLEQVGRDWRDVYAVIHAESGWAPRDGMGRNGKVSMGVSQLEEETARGLGVTDPNDVRQAVRATATLVRHAALWASARQLEMKDAAISVYYNLSTAARNSWDGRSIDSLPFETQTHVRNVSVARDYAESLGRQRAAFERQLLKTIQVRSSVPRWQEQPAQQAVGTEHLTLRTDQVAPLLQPAEDAARLKVRHQSAGSQPGAGPQHAIAMNGQGLEDFSRHMKAALKRVREASLAARDSVRETLTRAEGAINTALVRSHRVLAGVLGEEMRSLPAYFEQIKKAHALDVSRALGDRTNIVRGAAMQQNAAQAVAEGGDSLRRELSAMQARTTTIQSDPVQPVPSYDQERNFAFQRP